MGAGVLRRLVLRRVLLLAAARVPRLTAPAAWVPRRGPVAAGSTGGLPGSAVVLPVSANQVMAASSPRFGVAGGITGPLQGTVEVELAVGQGTTFTVAVPQRIGGPSRRMSHAQVLIEPRVAHPGLTGCSGCGAPGDGHTPSHDRRGGAPAQPLWESSFALYAAVNSRRRGAPYVPRRSCHVAE